MKRCKDCVSNDSPRMTCHREMPDYGKDGDVRIGAYNCKAYSRKRYVKLKDLNWHFITTWAVILTIDFVIIMLVFGCSQRIVEYNPDTGVWRYKANNFATKSQANRVTIRTTSGLVVDIDKAEQDNDSVKASALIGGVPVVVESKGE